MALCPAPLATDELLAQGQVGLWRAELAPDSPWIGPGSPIWLSGGFRRLLGLPGEEGAVPLEAWVSRILPEDRGQFWRRLAEHFLHGAPFQLAHRVSTRANALCWLLARGQVQPGEEGAGRQLCGVVCDITAVKQAEDQAVALEAARLRQEQMASLVRVAGGIAYDFNNMMTVVLGQTDLLLATETDPARRRRAEAMRKAVGRIAELCHDLLAFAGRQALRVQEVDLNEVARPIVALYERIEELMGVEVRSELDPKVGRVHADVVQLDRIVMNLMMNARDALPNGGTITLRTRRVDLKSRLLHALGELPAGRYSVLSVTDSGDGVPREILSRLCEPFFTTRTAERRRGMGLSVAHGVLAQLHGGLVVESPAGGGATFSVYLPEAQTRVGVAPAPGPAPRRQHTTVLVVDDEPMILEVARAGLEADGHQVLVASDGEAALEVGGDLESPPDLLLANASLPGLNGRELARRFARLHSATRVILMTAQATPTLESIGGDNVVAILVKPFALAELRRLVALHLREPSESP